MYLICHLHARKYLDVSFRHFQDYQSIDATKRYMQIVYFDGTLIVPKGRKTIPNLKGLLKITSSLMPPFINFTKPEKVIVSRKNISNYIKMRAELLPCKGVSSSASPLYQ